MRSLGYAIAAGVLLMATSAQAGYEIDALARGNSAVRLDDGAPQTRKLGDNKVQSMGQGGSADAFVSTSGDSISFKSGVATVGDDARSFSVSGVDLTIVNTGSQGLQLNNFHSTIVPAGMGFFLQDRSGSTIPANIFTDYGQTDAASWANVFDVVGENTPFARVGFAFDIYGDGYDAAAVYDPFAEGHVNGSIYTLSGYVELSFDGLGALQRNEHITAAQSAMPSFQVAANNAVAYGYDWQATDIGLELSKFLAPDESTNLYYRTAVYADTAFGCLPGGLTCLVAYSGFGDPIGRGGGISSLAARGFGPMAEPGNCMEGPNCTIKGLVFNPDPIQGISFDVTTVQGGVPEPATWLMMIAGFGLMGAALRRRRLLSYS